MKFKYKMIILSLFLTILCISAVSATENNTDVLNIEENANDLEIKESVNHENAISASENTVAQTNNKEEVEITPMDSNLPFNSQNLEIYVSDKNNKELSGVLVKIKAYTGDKYKVYQKKTDKSGYAYFDFKNLASGKHKLEISVDTDKYAKTMNYTIKIEKPVLFTSHIDSFIKGSNKKFKVKIYYIDGNLKAVSVKNLKLKIKVKIGKTVKTYNVKTDSKGWVSLFNVKNLKVGDYKVTITSGNGGGKYIKLNNKIYLSIYKPAKKTATLKMGATKKLKNGDVLETFFTNRDDFYDKGVHARCFNSEDFLNGLTHTWIVKAKFFFKNVKTGKIITKTAKSKVDKYYILEPPRYNLISGYKPVKTQIWYVTNK